MAPLVKIAFASGTEELNERLVQRMEAIFPELPLYVVSEFPPSRGAWIPYHPRRNFRHNFARCRAAFKGKRIRLAGVLLVPRLPYRRMRLIALLLSPSAFMAFNENLDHWMLRPRSAPAIARHLLWRVKNLLRSQFRPGGEIYTFFWRLQRPREWRTSLDYARARVSRPKPAPMITRLATRPDVPGISVIIPSRNGRHLLEAQLPEILRQQPLEVIVIDNGSADGTAAWLATVYPCIVVEFSSEPLSFARAINLGLRRARGSHVCLLNNDMLIRPGFFGALQRAFEQVPDLFCATAQIVFPPGERRQETGKAVYRPTGSGDFPVTCIDPIPGENYSYVYYGSGGCSLYDRSRLEALGGVNEIYEPAYVEDLDLGYRAWLRGWPSVFVADAVVEHRHRATTSRYFSEEQLARMLEVNYLRFAAQSEFLWRQALDRLRIRARLGDSAAADALRGVGALSVARSQSDSPNAVPLGNQMSGTQSSAANPDVSPLPEQLVFAIGSGDVAVFPASQRRQKPVVLVTSPYVPFPLSHGGAVRIYNLMRRAAQDFDQVLVAFSETLETPAPELLEICCEIVLVKRTGSHSLPFTDRPETVEEFDSPVFHAALRQTLRKWQPAIVQLEFTQMAQYAADCAGPATLLVEHDITFDLYSQLVREPGNFDAKLQLPRWRSFETAAWRQVDYVVTMSEKDRGAVEGAPAVVVPNGVDVQRFRPASTDGEPRRLLFIGSFQHQPNVMAIRYFLTSVWPLLTEFRPTLHIIAGARHEQFIRGLDLRGAGIEVDGFVADVRGAYARAGIVIAPLVASAGTNIKILEAMAMGKAIVSTPAGVNGLDLRPGEAVIVTGDMASAILRLFDEPAERQRLGQAARRAAERDWSWERIAELQKELYETAIRDYAVGASSSTQTSRKLRYFSA